MALYKKITAAFAAALLLCSVAAAFSDIDDEKLAIATETLSTIGILDGMSDGTYQPQGLVTREQFAKIAVCVLGQREKAAASPSAAVFTDVAPDSWASGYISYVAENGIIAGFPDGSFGGSSVVSYAQAVTVLMRCMGYTDEEIGFHWPSDYVGKAEALGLSAGVSLSANDPVTRGDAALLVYNALFTDINGQTGTKLITKTGLTFYDDAVLYGLNKSDSTVAETSEGSFKIAASAIGLDGGVGHTGMLFLDKDKEIILFKGGGDDGSEIVVSSCIKNDERGTVDVTYAGGVISIPAKGTVYYDGVKSTAEDVAADITTGSKMTIFRDEAGRYSSGVLYSYVMQGPKTVTGGSEQIYELFALSSAPSVIRRGVSAQMSDIAQYDVVYYAENTNTIYAYDDKISGIYEKATPNKADAAQVTVSGKTYRVASATAMNKLNESAGAFAIGDFVTLLLDRNGDVADAVDTSAAVGRSLGVLLNAYSKVNADGNQEYVAKLFLPDGTEMEYAADKDYSKHKGKLMEIRFEDGRLHLGLITYSSMSGNINKELRSFDGYWLATDCSVLVLVSNPDDGDAVVRKIRFSDIEGTSLTKNQVLHIELSGEMNDVALMYLQNVTKTDYEYGIIVGRDISVERDEDGNIVKKRSAGSCEILLHGEESSINVGRRVFATSVIGINSVTGDYADAVQMGSGRRITAVTGDKIKVGSTVYKTAESIDIYRFDGYNEYSLISPDEAMKLGDASVELYGDDKADRGGKVRLIIIR